MFRVTSSLPSSVGYQSILFLPVSSILKSHNAVISAEDSVTIVPLAQLNQWLSSKNPEQIAILLAQEASTLVESNPELALALLHRIETLQPQSAMNYYNKGCVFAAQGKLSDAEIAFSQAISLDDHMGEAYFNRAVVALLQNNNIKAIADLSKAGELGLYRAYNLIKQAQKQQTK